MDDAHSIDPGFCPREVERRHHIGRLIVVVSVHARMERERFGTSSSTTTTAGCTRRCRT
jgi:hypothetical protein